MRRTALIAAAFLSLGACASTTDNTPQDNADKVTAIYAPVRLVASLCAAGVSKPCQDLNVRAAIKKALPIADAAVAEAVKQLSADSTRSNVAKWTSYAVSAVNVLSDALVAYEVKG